MFSDYYTLSNDHDPATFDLFLQWLYTRKYQEKDADMSTINLINLGLA